MALQIDVVIAGEEDKEALDVVASLARLQELLERIDDAQRTSVTLRLSPVLAARQQQSGADWDPSGALLRVWDSREWVAYRRGADRGSFAHTSVEEWQGLPMDEEVRARLDQVDAMLADVDRRLTERPGQHYLGGRPVEPDEPRQMHGAVKLLAEVVRSLAERQAEGGPQL